MVALNIGQHEIRLYSEKKISFQALVHAKSDSTYENIWASTFGIAFFGTPHKGGNHAGLGDVAASIARIITGSPENTFMKALKARSEILDHMSDDFRQLLEDFQILSFYETRPMHPLGLVSIGTTHQGLLG